MREIIILNRFTRDASRGDPAVSAQQNANRNGEPWVVIKNRSETTAISEFGYKKNKALFDKEGYKVIQTIKPDRGRDAVRTTDPPVSAAQRKAMFAAAAGHSTLGIPKKVGEEFVGKADSHDCGGDCGCDSCRVKDAATVKLVKTVGKYSIYHVVPEERGERPWYEVTEKDKPWMPKATDLTLSEAEVWIKRWGTNDSAMVKRGHTYTFGKSVRDGVSFQLLRKAYERGYSRYKRGEHNYENFYHPTYFPEEFAEFKKGFEDAKAGVTVENARYSRSR